MKSAMRSSRTLDIECCGIGASQILTECRRTLPPAAPHPGTRREGEGRSHAVHRGVFETAAGTTTAGEIASLAEATAKLWTLEPVRHRQDAAKRTAQPGRAQSHQGEPRTIRQSFY